MNKEDFLFVEKYRPHTIEDCILPVDTKNILKEYVRKREVPNLLLTGSCGTGKTSSARALCDEIGLDYIFINGSSENGIDTFRNKITNYASSVSLSGGRKVIIIDEADYLNPNTIQPALRAGIEAFSKNCSFIFTANYPNRIDPAIHSRCAVIKFSMTKEDKKILIPKFFNVVCGILEKEGIEYEKEAVAQFINKWFPDNRRILNEIQNYSQLGKIDVGILSNFRETSLVELVGYLKEKNFGKVRIWLSNNSVDSSSFYRKLYDSLLSVLVPRTIPQVILIIAKYQYQDAFSADKELNILACLVEIMAEGEFK